MLKWLITLFIVLLVLALVAPGSAVPPARRRDLRLGNLPGDLRIPARGRVLYIPFTSTVLLSLAVYFLGRLL